MATLSLPVDMPTFKTKALHLVSNLQQVECLILMANTASIYTYFSVTGKKSLLVPRPFLTLTARVII